MLTVSRQPLLTVNMRLITKRKVSEEIDQAKTGSGIRRERKAAGVSLRSIAKAMKLSAPYVSDLELGRRGWNHELLMRYSSALKLLAVRKALARKPVDCFIGESVR